MFFVVRCFLQIDSSENLKIQNLTNRFMLYPIHTHNLIRFNSKHLKYTYIVVHFNKSFPFSCLQVKKNDENKEFQLIQSQNSTANRQRTRERINLSIK